MKLHQTIRWAAASLVLVASANAATTFYPGILKHEIYNATTLRPQIGGGPGRGISINSDPIKAGGTVLATLATESGAPTNATIIAEWPAGATITHDGGALSNVLGGKRLIFLTGTREFNGGSGDGAGFFDLTTDGAKMLINAVKYMAGAGKTNVLFVSLHSTDTTPTVNAAGNGFTNAPDKGYTDLLKANGLNVTRYVSTGTPDAATVNSADVVVVSRSNASGNFQNANADNWNNITAPMIILNGYLLRQNRLGFYTANNIPDATSGANLKLTVNNAAHPIFAGVNTANAFAGYPLVYRAWNTNALRSVAYPTAWDMGGATYDNYSSRSSGLISVNQTGDYDFLLASDDDTDLYISTNEDPANKYLIAQEENYSNRRSWITAGAAPSTTAQKNSATWGLGARPNGIRLVANSRYYLEAIHHNGTGGDQVGVTMVFHGTAPTDNDATTLQNGLTTYGFTTTIGYNLPTPTTLSFSENPSNKTVYASMAAVFRVVVATDSIGAPGYQWRRNGVNITNATGPSYTLMASTNDSTAVFDCVVQVPASGTPALSKTSTPATLTVQPISGATLVQGNLKRELINGQNGNVVARLEAGNMPAPNTVTWINALDVGSPGSDIAQRVSGFFTPAATAYYTFFVSSDDASKLFVSTDDQPKNKRWVAEETAWSANRAWNSSGGNSALSQKRSDQFSPDGFVTTPFQNGIQMQAGQRYYIEGLQYNGSGGNGLSVTVLTTNEVTASGLPLDDDATKLTNGVLSFATSPTSLFTITNQPQNTQVFEAANYTLVVGVRTDSELTPAYQWKRNGQVIANATGASISGTATLADNGAQYTCEISLPGQTTLVSQQARLTVNSAAFAAGLVKREVWLNDSPVTRQIVGANVPGTFPVADEITYVAGFDVGSRNSDHFIQRLSGYFVPPASGLYVFFLATDDDSDLYLSTNDQPATKRMIAQETGYSGQRNWNTIGGGTSTVAQKRSDQFTPDGGVTMPGNPNGVGGLQLTGGTRYYLEVVHHENTGGDNCAVTYGRYDPLTGVVTNAPADGDASRLTGTAVGVLIPAPSVLEFTTSPQSVAVPDFTFPVYFSAGVTSDVAQPFIQWRKNEVNIPGANGLTYGFMTSRSDASARIDVVASLATLVKTSAVAIVTFQSNATFVPNALAQELWGPNNTALNRAGVEGFSYGPASRTGTIQGSFESPQNQGENFVQRVRGFFIPPATTNYVFFVNSDDDSDLFLSTDADPKNKRLIAQESAWSDPRNWLSFSNGTTTGQKRSDQWSPDAGLTVPYSEGILLTSGNRYYIEAVHHEGTSGDNLGVTFKMGIDPSNDPTNGPPSVLTGSLIGYLAAPSNPVLTITPAGNSVVVSWTPSGGALKSSPEVGAAMNTWSTLSTTNPATIPIGAGSLFMRVQQ